MKITQKTKEEILNSKFDNNTDLTREEAEKLSRLHDEINGDIKKHKRLTFKSHVLENLSLFFFLLLFSIIGSLGLSFVTMFLNIQTIEVFPFLGWGYYALLIYAGLSLILKWKPNVNVNNLGVNLIGVYFVVFIFTWLFQNNFDINDNFGRYILMDDVEYSEDDYGNGGSYGSSFFFISKHDLVDGCYNDGKIEIKNGGKIVTFKDEYGETRELNTRRAMFWQYAMALGYKPITSNYPSIGFFEKLFLILPPYFLDVILRSLDVGFFFTIYMIWRIKTGKFDLE